MTGRPPELSDYELRHAILHLLAAGAVDQLHALLTLTDRGGTNTWFTLKDARGDGAGYGEDVLEALAGARRELFQGGDAPSARALARFLEYAAILATLNSFADRIAGGVLARLVETGVWHWRTAFSYAQRVPQAGERIEALAAILFALTPDARAEAFAAMRQAVHALKAATFDSRTHFILLARAASSMAKGICRAGDHGTLVTLARECQTWLDEPGMIDVAIEVLREAIAINPPEVAAYATELRTRTADPYARARCVAFLPEHERASIGGAVIRQLPVLDDVSSSGLIRILEELGPFVDPQCCMAAADRILRRELAQSPVSAEPLVRLLPWVSEQHRSAIATVLVEHWSKGLGAFEPRTMVAPVSRLSVEAREVFIESVKRVRWTYVRCMLMSVLLRFESPEPQRESAAAIEAYAVSARQEGDSFSADVLVTEYASSAPQLVEAGRETMLACIMSIEEPRYRLRALTAIFPVLSPVDRTNAMRHAANVAPQIREQDDDVVRVFWETAAANVEGRQLADLVRTARRLHDEQDITGGLSALLADVGDADRPEVLTHTFVLLRRLRGRDRLKCLQWLRTELDEPHRALSASMIDPEIEPMESLRTAAAIAAFSESGETRRRLAAIVDAAKPALSRPFEEGEALVQILNAFPERRTPALIEQCLEALGRIEPSVRARILVRCGTWCGDRFPRLVTEIVRDAMWDEREAVRRDTLKVLASVLPYAVARDTATRLIRARDDYTSLGALPALLARIGELGRRRVVLALVRRADGWENGEIIEAVAPYLRREDVLVVLPRCLAIANAYLRETGLLALCRRAAAVDLASVLAPHALRMINADFRMESLASLVPGAPHPVRAELLDAILAMLREGNIVATHTIAPALMQGCPDRASLCAALTEILTVLCTKRPRRDFVRHSSNFSEALLALGGSTALRHHSASTRRVCEWWP